MTASPYREDREPCRECARREAEGPHVPWYQAVARELVRPFDWKLILVAGTVCLGVTTAKYAAWSAQQPDPPQRCFFGDYHDGQVCLWSQQADRISCHGSITDALAAAKQIGCIATVRQ